MIISYSLVIFVAVSIIHQNLSLLGDRAMLLATCRDRVVLETHRRKAAPDCCQVWAVGRGHVLQRMDMNGWCADKKGFHLWNRRLRWSGWTTSGTTSWLSVWKWFKALPVPRIIPDKHGYCKDHRPNLCYKQELKSVQGSRQRCLQRSFTRCNLHKHPPIWPVWIWETNSFRNSEHLCLRMAVSTTMVDKSISA